MRRSLNLFRHDPHDEQVRRATEDAVKQHRRSLMRVRRTLRSADETLSEEIARLELALNKD